MGTRSTSFNIFVADEARQPILNSIRRYRAGCREMFGALLCAQAAGATIELEEDRLSLKPDTDNAKLILATAMDKDGKAFCYQFRDWFRQALYPGSLSFVWDSARRDVVTAWQSKDPEKTRASRGWLALQGVRGIAQFNRRGIGFPKATARPKLEAHSLTLKWDDGIGTIVFRVPRLDCGAYYVWKQLREEAWALGTLYLNERDGELKVTLSYERPDQIASVDKDRVCTVKLTPEPLFSLEATDAQDTISGLEVQAWLAYMKARRKALEDRRAACGSRRRPWGFRKGFDGSQEVLSRVTLARERGVADRNHAWTRRIVSRCVNWRCGTIQIALPAESELYGHPWKWAQFRDFLAYKAGEKGIVLA